MSNTKLEKEFGKLHVFYGNCLICDTPITNEEGKPVDCYNPKCIEIRKTMVVPDGWTITPLEKSFSG